MLYVLIFAISSLYGMEDFDVETAGESTQLISRGTRTGAPEVLSPVYCQVRDELQTHLASIAEALHQQGPSSRAHQQLCHKLRSLSSAIGRTCIDHADEAAHEKKIQKLREFAEQAPVVLSKLQKSKTRSMASDALLAEAADFFQEINDFITAELNIVPPTSRAYACLLHLQLMSAEMVACLKSPCTKATFAGALLVGGGVLARIKGII